MSRDVCANDTQCSLYKQEGRPRYVYKGKKYCSSCEYEIKMSTPNYNPYYDKVEDPRDVKKEDSKIEIPSSPISDNSQNKSETNSSSSFGFSPVKDSTSSPQDVAKNATSSPVATDQASSKSSNKAKETPKETYERENGHSLSPHISMAEEFGYGGVMNKEVSIDRGLIEEGAKNTFTKTAGKETFKAAINPMASILMHEFNPINIFKTARNPLRIIPMTFGAMVRSLAPSNIASTVGWSFIAAGVSSGAVAPIALGASFFVAKGLFSGYLASRRYKMRKDRVGADISEDEILDKRRWTNTSHLNSSQIDQLNDRFEQATAASFSAQGFSVMVNGTQMVSELRSAKKADLLSEKDYAHIRYKYSSSLSNDALYRMISHVQSSKSGDSGIDVIAEKDGYLFLISCKRYASNVGVKEVRDIHSVASSKYFKGAVPVLITTEGFSSDAKSFAKDNEIYLNTIDEFYKYGI